MKFRIEDLENLHTFEELADLGVTRGSIVAYPGTVYENIGVSWDYVLLREGTLLGNFDTSICCYKDPRYPSQPMNLFQIGFHWQGSTDRFKFRIANEKEIEEFKKACTDVILNPSEFWTREEKSQILHNMKRDGLISDYMARKINKQYKDEYGVDLLKVYRKYY